MHFMMTPSEHAKLIRSAPWYFFGGVVVVMCGFLSHHFITFTGFMAIALGAAVLGMKQDAVRQPLMWLISGLLLVISLLMYAGYAYLEFWQLISGGRESVWSAIGLTALTSILWILSRFLYTFTLLNWQARRAFRRP